jgi:hypothetical protein
MSKKKWTPEKLAKLKELFPRTMTKDIAVILDMSVQSCNFNAYKLGLRKDKDFIYQSQYGNIMALRENGKTYRFPKGHVPQNKGKKISDETRAKCQHTFYKKGSIPPNVKPVGYERINGEGYVEIKVAEGKGQFVSKHRVIWEQQNGPVPARHVIIFADGDKTNFDIDNLVCVSRQDLAVRNRYRKKYGPEIAENIILLSKIKNHLSKL